MNRPALLVLFAVAAIAGAIFLLNRDERAPAPPDGGTPAGTAGTPAAAPEPLRAPGAMAPAAAGAQPGGDGSAPAAKPEGAPAPVAPVRPAAAAPFRLDPQVDTAFIEETSEVLREQACEIETEHGRRALTADEIKLVGQELELARRSVRSALDGGADVGELAHLFEQLNSVMRTERLIDKIELHEQGRVNPGLMRVRSSSGGDDRVHRFVVETGRARIDLRVSRDAASHWKIPLSGTGHDWQTTLQR